MAVTPGNNSISIKDSPRYVNVFGIQRLLPLAVILVSPRANLNIELQMSIICTRNTHSLVVDQTNQLIPTQDCLINRSLRWFDPSRGAVEGEYHRHNCQQDGQGPHDDPTSRPELVRVGSPEPQRVP